MATKSKSSTPKTETLLKSIDDAVEDLQELEENLNARAADAISDPDSEEDRTLRAVSAKVREARKVLEREPVQ